LRLKLVEVLVAEAPRRIAIARLCPAEDRERDASALQDRRERARDALVAAVVRGRTADEVQVLGIRLLGDRWDLEPLSPVAARVARLAPWIAGALDVRHRALRFRRHRALHERKVTAHVDDLVDVLDRHRARLDARRAGRAGPELLGLGLDPVRWRRRAIRGHRAIAVLLTAEQLRSLAQQLVADIEDDLLRVKRLSGRERGTVVGAAAALGAGVAVQQLLPREIADRGRAKRLLV